MSLDTRFDTHFIARVLTCITARVVTGVIARVMTLVSARLCNAQCIPCAYSFGYFLILFARNIGSKKSLHEASKVVFCLGLKNKKKAPSLVFMPKSYF